MYVFMYMYKPQHYMYTMYVYVCKRYVPKCIYRLGMFMCM